MESSTPVAFLLDYAASLGITKDITKTQAYSVWLQGVPFIKAIEPRNLFLHVLNGIYNTNGVALCTGAVVLVILAATDAAYSGDWSRIGVISEDIELGLRPLLGLLGIFHIFCGFIAAVAASKKGYNPVPPTLKVQCTALILC